MTPTRQGSFHLFRLAGIDVHLHWSWFLIAIYQISTRPETYTTPVWKVLEYLALFVIVLMHEFGHALACRQVGGTADQIVLWPLGGVAYVDAPQRPGATLWSIAAGPLVNVVLVPVFLLLTWVASVNGWAQSLPDVRKFIGTLAFINLGLLIFNLLPVYPLDGGQILRSLLWYPFGKAKSLMIATVLGFAGGLALIGLALWNQSLWFGVMAGFLLMNCWGAFKHSRALLRIARLPRREGFSCPECRTAPPAGAYWGCGQCGKPFDMFAAGGVCSYCGAAHEMTTCPDCGGRHPPTVWQSPL
ncbi:MAG: M50 family metallopeptidase [Verrucomicrobia bacterium]|nr:M50 family metallopeptidase [Verrucomicrobiota bacterium]